MTLMKRTAHPTLIGRLTLMVAKRQVLPPFTPTELDLVRCWAPGGLERVVTEPAVPDPGEARRAWKRLERAGYLRPAERAGVGGPDSIPAISRLDGTPVELFGDYAIVAALRGHPATLGRFRRYEPPGGMVELACFYTGVGPDVYLLEVPGMPGDVRLGFGLERGDEGLLSAYYEVGALKYADDLDPPDRVEVAAAEACAHWVSWTEVEIVRPDGPEATVTSFVVGRGDDGLWLVESPGEAAMATWVAPEQIERYLTDLIAPAPGTPRWLPDAVFEEIGERALGH